MPLRQDSQTYNETGLYKSNEIQVTEGTTELAKQTKAENIEVSSEPGYLDLFKKQYRRAFFVGVVIAML